MTDVSPSTGRREVRWLAVATYVVLLVVCALLSVAWLAVGAVVAVAASLPSFASELATAAAAGNRWAGGVLDAVPRSEPPAQAVLDYSFSGLSVSIAVALLASRQPEWSVRLMALAMIASAGAFNLQANAAAMMQNVSGLASGELHQVLLHGAAYGAFTLALLTFPTVHDTVRDRLAGLVAVAVGVGVLLLLEYGTALLPHATSCVVFFCFLVPTTGLLTLRGKMHRARTGEAQVRARLLFSVLAGSLAVGVVLAIISLLVWSIGWTGLALVDLTATERGSDDGASLALMFWYSRLACVGIAGAVLFASRRGASWTAESQFSRGLAAALVAALIGGGYFVLSTLAGYVIDDSTVAGAVAVAAVATVPAALAFLPVYVRSERLVDRLLYGTRPTPYSVLAGIGALSRATASDSPDLARVAEGVGRGLGATTCRLRVRRPGLRDRVYTWASAEADPVVEVDVWHRAERIGSIAVDRSAVAGLGGQRQHLLEDIADSLGAVFQASRAGIELERQLRAALAYAGGIAVSRRAVVAEMDGERRRIERDLHDGAQHHLVSLRLTLGLVEHQVSTAQFDQARSRLDQIAGQIDVAESILAETAEGVSSPLLATVGLVGALRLELEAGQPPITVDADGVDEQLHIPPDVESAVYFCCLEAVNNARKHTRGAAISVRLSTSEGRLQFVVHDEGLGWDAAVGPRSPGRGLRNVTARVAAVSGRVEVRSSPGAGTTVEGSAPLLVPQKAPTTDASSRTARSGPTPPAVVTAIVPLIDQVRDALREARELYHGTAQADPLLGLAKRLDEPLRIAVVGPAGSGTSTLAEALRGAIESDRDEVHPPLARLIDVPGLGTVSPTATQRAQDLLVTDGALGPAADGYVLLLRHGHLEDVELLSVLHRGVVRHRPALAIGVLARVDELLTAEDSGEEPPAANPIGLELAERAAVEWGARPDVRRLCQVVVPVAGLLARAAGTTTDADHRELVVLSEFADSGRSSATHRELLERYGTAGTALALDLIRSGRAPTATALRTELTRLSGLPRLLDLIDTRFARRAEAVKARSALVTLEGLVRTEPPPGSRRDRLLYRLDRIRSGAHEVAEIDLVDTLRSGELDLSDGDREAAEQLLGAMGTAPWIRLGLARSAGSPEVARTAAEQSARWQRLKSHPMSTKDARDVAASVVQTCEQLRARAGAR